MPRPDVAVIGSGSLFHNFEYMMGPKRGRPIDPSFDAALSKLLTDPAISPAQRKEALLRWRVLPGSALYQPDHRGDADHFMPLLTLVAAAGYMPPAKALAYPMHAAKTTDYIW